MGIKTVAQIAREYSVHPVQVSQWKTVIRERLPDLFESGSKAMERQEKLVADLHQKIGELTVDRPPVQIEGFDTGIMGKPP